MLHGGGVVSADASASGLRYFFEEYEDVEPANLEKEELELRDKVRRQFFRSAAARGGGGDGAFASEPLSKIARALDFSTTDTSTSGCSSSGIIDDFDGVVPGLSTMDASLPLPSLPQSNAPPPHRPSASHPTLERHPQHPSTFPLPPPTFSLPQLFSAPVGGLSTLPGGGVRMALHSHRVLAATVRQ